MICESLLVVITTTLLQAVSPDQPAGSTGTEQQCVADEVEAKTAFARRVAMSELPGQHQYRVTAQVFKAMPDGQHIHLYDLPTGKP